MKIRFSKPEDSKSILQVHYDSVHNIACKDYSKKILDDWSPPVTAKRISEYKKKSKDRKKKRLGQCIFPLKQKEEE